MHLFVYLLCTGSVVLIAGIPSLQHQDQPFLLTYEVQFHLVHSEPPTETVTRLLTVILRLTETIFPLDSVRLISLPEPSNKQCQKDH